MQPTVEALSANREFVRELARALLRDEHQAEDVAQDVLCAAQGKAADTAAAMQHWFARVTRNFVSNLRRSERRRRAREEALAQHEETPSTLELVERESVRRQVLDAVCALPEPQRGIVLMRYYEGLSAVEIARRRGRSASTIRTQLAQGLEMLRSRLEAADQERHRDWRALAAWWARGASRSTATLAFATARRVAIAGLLLALGVGAVIFGTGGGASPPTPPAVPPLSTKVDRERGARGADETRATIDDGGSRTEVSPTAERLNGLVVDADRRPIRGAVVEIRAAQSMLMSALVADTAPTTLRTDDDGRFACDAARGASHRIRVCATGFASHTEQHGFAGPTLEIVLSRASLVHGRVTLAPSDTPCADAEVVLFRPNSASRWSAKTDADGFYRIDDIEPGRVSVDVIADASPRALKSLQLERDSKTQLDIALVMRTDVVGRVIDRELGLPIANARLTLRRTRAVIATTDNDGRYRARGLVDTNGAELEVHAAGCSSQRHSLCVPARDDGLRHIDFALDRAAIVKLRVIDDHGRGIEGAAVSLLRSFDSGPGIDVQSVGASSSADGTCVIESVPARALLTLCAEHRSFARAVRELPAVTIANETLQLPDLVLHTPSVLEGSVVDADGQPLSGIHVTLTCDDTERDAWREGLDVLRGAEPYASDCGRVRTGANGRFAFGALAAGRHTLHAAFSGGGSVTESIDIPRGAIIANRELRLLAGLTIEGEVLTASGQRTDRVYVRVEPLDGQTDAHGLRSAPGGKLVVRQLAHGRYRLHVHPIDDGIGLPSLFECDAGARDLQFRLTEGVPISGTVRRPDGTAARARVHARTNDAGEVMNSDANCAADGSFRIEVPLGRRVQLWVSEADAPAALPCKLRDAAALCDLLGPRSDIAIVVE